MKQYRFYGWEHADVPAVTHEYSGIRTPRDLYDALSEIWCAEGEVTKSVSRKAW